MCEIFMESSTYLQYSQRRSKSAAHDPDEGKEF